MANLLGRSGEDSPTPWGYGRHAGPDALAEAADARPPLILVAQVAAAVENSIGVHTWRNGDSRAARYLVDPEAPACHASENVINAVYSCALPGDDEPSVAACRCNRVARGSRFISSAARWSAPPTRPMSRSCTQPSSAWAARAIATTGPSYGNGEVVDAAVTVVVVTVGAVRANGVGPDHVGQVGVLEVGPNQLGLRRIGIGQAWLARPTNGSPGAVSSMGRGSFALGPANERLEMPGARYAAVVVVITMTGAPSLVLRSGTAALDRSPGATSQLVQLPPTEIQVPGASSLTAISCVSPSDCFVSGTAGPPVDPVGLVAQVMGGKVVKTLRMSMPRSALDGITCLSAELCIVVGSAEVKTTPAVTDGLVSLLADGAFRDTTPYATVNTYKAVACETTQDCLAVGYTDNFQSGVLTDVYLTPSSAVPMVATPGFAPGTSELAAVSCPSTNHCYVVGGWYGRADVYQSVVITIIKHAASKPAATNLPNYGADDGVACLSNSSCTAVGNMETNEQTFTYEGFWQSVSPPGGAPHIQWVLRNI